MELKLKDIIEIKNTHTYSKDYWLGKAILKSLRMIKNFLEMENLRLV